MKPKIILTCFIALLLAVVLSANAFFQYNFFQGWWKVDPFWIVLILVAENLSKLVLEFGSIIIPSTTTGYIKFIASALLWMFLFSLLCFGALQTFVSRSYFSQLEEIDSSRKTKTEELAILRERRDREMQRLKMSDAKDQAIIKAMSRTKNQWVLREWGKVIKSKDIDDTELQRLNDKINSLSKDVNFTYIQSVENIVQGKVNKIHLIADASMPIVFEGLIFMLSLLLSLLWKQDIIKVLSVEVLSIVGKELLAIRVENELSQEAFAEKLGIATDTLITLEKSKHTIPFAIQVKLNKLYHKGIIL